MQCIETAMSTLVCLHPRLNLSLSHPSPVTSDCANAKPLYIMTSLPEIMYCLKRPCLVPPYSAEREAVHSPRLVAKTAAPCHTSIFVIFPNAHVPRPFGPTTATTAHLSLPLGAVNILYSFSNALQWPRRRGRDTARGAGYC